MEKLDLNSNFSNDDGENSANFESLIGAQEVQSCLDDLDNGGEEENPENLYQNNFNEMANRTS